MVHALLRMEWSGSEAASRCCQEGSPFQTAGITSCTFQMEGKAEGGGGGCP